MYHCSFYLQFDASSQSLDQRQILAEQIQVPFVDQEIRQRDAAIRRVESTIVQLGEIYEQFSTLVHEQGDLVMRIDSTTENAELNIDLAHTKLIDFMRQISTQRAFLLKIFVVVVLCFAFFAWYSK